VTGLPTGATATITPNRLSAGASATNVSLIVQLPSQTALLRHGEILALRLSPMMGIVVLPFAGKLRRSTGKRGRVMVLLSLVFLGLSLVGLTSCGSKDSGFLGSSQKSYTITVAASSGTLSHSTTLNLTVK
jgi:hypothetical protein